MNRLQHAIGWAGVAFGLIAATSAFVWHATLVRQVRSQQVSLERLRAEASAARQQAGGSVSEFERSLARLTHDTSSTESLLGEIAHDAVPLHVTLSGVSAATIKPTPQALGHVDLTLVLQGTYANLRAALADMADRHPSLVVQHLSLRRGALVSSVEAQVVLQHFSRPLAAPETALSPRS